MNGATLRIYKLTALSAWASYLINGDASGLDDGEAATVDAWLAAEEVPGSPATCDDAGFRWRHDASNYALAGDCQTYVWLIPPGHALYDISSDAKEESVDVDG